MGFWFFVCFLNNDICGAGHNSTGKGGEISVGNYNHPIATCFLPWLFLSSAHVNMKVSLKKKKKCTASDLHPGSGASTGEERIESLR